MTPAHPQTAFFTLAALGLCAFTLLVVCIVMRRSAANLFIAGFLGCVIPAPVMLVTHPTAAVAMFGLGLACLVPAVLLAEDHDDDGRRDGDGGDPAPTGPDTGPDSDLWREFEHDFWAHVEQRRPLVVR